LRSLGLASQKNQSKLANEGRIFRVEGILKIAGSFIQRFAKMVNPLRTESSKFQFFYLTKKQMTKKRQNPIKRKKIVKKFFLQEIFFWLSRD